jgi:hypothetical protein
MIADSGNRAYVYFADVMQDYLDGCKEYIAKCGVSNEAPSVRVVEAIQHALSSDAPKEHYLAVPEQFQAMITIRKAFEELLHLNRNHAHSYARAQLIAMMDEEWAIQKGEKSRDRGGEVSQRPGTLVEKWPAAASDCGLRRFAISLKQTHGRRVSGKSVAKIRWPDNSGLAVSHAPAPSQDRPFAARYLSIRITNSLFAAPHEANSV